MEGRLVLKNCSLLHADGRVRTGMSVLVDGRLIASVEPDERTPVRPGDWEVRCRGRLVLPGLVDCHSRLVGAPLTPWGGALRLRPFGERLEQERRDARGLTVGEVQAVTAASLAQGLRRGVTTVVEHLHAPGCVEEALLAQARVAEQLGARLVNAHASTSLDDEVPGPAQVEANARYAASRGAGSIVRGALGVRASFCADDALLRAAGRAKEALGVGAHVAVAEDAHDVAVTRERWGLGVVDRLERFGLLGEGSVAAHGQALARAEAARLAERRTLVALTPSAAPALEALLLERPHAGVGSGGLGCLWDELAACSALSVSLARAGRLGDPDALMGSLLAGGPSQLLTHLSGAPSGVVEPGALADLVVSDFVPTGEPGERVVRLLPQLSQAGVAWTIVDGRVTVREGQVLGADHLELAREAAAALRSARRRGGAAAGEGASPP